MRRRCSDRDPPRVCGVLALLAGVFYFRYALDKKSERDLVCALIFFCHLLSAYTTESGSPTRTREIIAKVTMRLAIQIWARRVLRILWRASLKEQHDIVYDKIVEAGCLWNADGFDVQNILFLQHIRTNEQ